MLTLALKFFFEKILPSVLTTVTAAYIVNHYIADKPADAPLTAAAPAVAPEKAGSNNPEAGVRAKGVSEKAVAKVEAGKVQPETAAAKPAEKKRAEIASLPADAKKHQTARHEKAAKATSTPAQTASVRDDRRDANDLARAAIDRLRGTNDAPVRVEASRPQSEVSRAQQDADRQPVESTSPRLQVVTRAAPQPQPAMQPLPPAIRVSTPAVEMLTPDATGMEESQVNSDGRARLPVPPADIPEASRPLDLEANGAAPTMRTHTTVADDMLSAAKSVFQTVLPR